MDELKILLDYIVVPLLYVLYRFNQRVTILEAQQITKKDLEKIFEKIDDLKDEIHSKNEKYVSHFQCKQNCSN